MIYNTDRETLIMAPVRPKPADATPGKCWCCGMPTEATDDEKRQL